MPKPEDAEKVLRRDLANVIKKVQAGQTLTAAEHVLINSSGSAVGGDTSVYAKTYDELAQRLCLTRKTLQNARKRFPDDAPNPRADGRHDVAAWSMFVIRHNIARAAEHVAGAASAETHEEGPVTVTDWKAEELKLKCEKLQIENAKVAGELVVAAEMEAGLSTLVTAFRQALNNFGPRLAQKILNVSDYHEAEEIIQEEINVVLRTLQRCEFLEMHGGDQVSSDVAIDVQAQIERAEIIPKLPKGKPRGKAAKKGKLGKGKQPAKKAVKKGVKE